MKGKIFMYLFLFAALYIVFQYANVKKTFEVQEEKIASLEKEVDSLTLSQKNAIQQNAEQIDGFSLETNDKARAYFENLDYNLVDVKNRIEAEIIGKNKADADNELIPYSGMEGKFRVNRIKILNHKWVLAEFTDSVYWGEALISYFIDENNETFFETEDAFIYPKN